MTGKDIRIYAYFPNETFHFHSICSGICSRNMLCKLPFVAMVILGANTS